MVQPLVSIVMPAYNCQQYIGSAIQSVLKQTYQNWELLVIVDQSKDATYEIVLRMAEQDPRIHVILNAENMGAAKTRNRGLDLAQGEYVAFLDSDDCWHSDKLEIQLQRMQQDGADLSYTSYAIVDENGNPSKAPYEVPENISFNSLLKENFIGCSTVMISKKLAQKYRFTSEFYHEDYCLWLDLLREGYRTIGCSEVLVNWRLITTSRSFNKKNGAKNRWRIYREYLRLPLLKSIYCFVCYASRGMKKYYGKAKS